MGGAEEDKLPSPTVIIPQWLSAGVYTYAHVCRRSSSVTLHRPQCRFLLEDVTCCSTGALSTPQPHVHMRLVCSELTYVPESRCLMIQGPRNATVRCWGDTVCVAAGRICTLPSSVLLQCPPEIDL